MPARIRVQLALTVSRPGCWRTFLLRPHMNKSNSGDESPWGEFPIQASCSFEPLWEA